MKEKIEYIGYLGKREIESFRKEWGEYNIARIPSLHRKKEDRFFWGVENYPPVKVKITIEKI